MQSSRPAPQTKPPLLRFVITVVIMEWPWCGGKVWVCLATKTKTWAAVMYCAGVMIETLGLAVIAAHGWVPAAGAVCVCGYVLGTMGNRRWSEAEQSVSRVALWLKAYSPVSRRR
jgi:hypothetical protein